MNLFSRKHKRNPLKTCIKEKYCLFLQQIKRKNDGKGKYKLGRDIEAKQYTNNYGSGFYKNLSQDLKNEMPGVKGFSPINLRYMSKFFKLYAPLCEKVPQAAELFSDSLSDSNVPQAADDFKMLFLIHENYISATACIL